MSSTITESSDTTVMANKPKQLNTASLQTIKGSQSSDSENTIQLPPTPTAGGTQDPYYVNSWGIVDRWKLKKDPTLRRLVQRLWDSTSPSPSSSSSSSNISSTSTTTSTSPSSSGVNAPKELSLNRQSYIELNVRLSKAMLPKWTLEAATRMAQSEWMVDSRETTNEHPLSYPEFSPTIARFFTKIGDVSKKRVG